MKTGPGLHPGANSSAHEARPHGLRHNPRAVFLVGFMGAGKSTVGRALAGQMGWPFEDLDERLQAREKRSIEQIFRESGEAEFRRAEHQALRELVTELDSSPRVVALGGGAFVQPSNVALLAESKAPVIFLDAPVDELFRRCQQETAVERPLRRDQKQFRALYETRRPQYLAASLRIETSGKDVEAIAAEVAKSLGLRPNGESEGVEK